MAAWWWVLESTRKCAVLHETDASSAGPRGSWGRMEVVVVVADDDCSWTKVVA